MDPPAATEASTPPQWRQRRRRGGGRGARRPLVGILIFIIFLFFFILSSLLKLVPIALESVQDHHNSDIDLPWVEEDHRIDLLRNISHKYYIYDLPEHLILSPNNNHDNHVDFVWSLYKSLQGHSLRTFDPNEATFFIPPLFVMYCQQKWQREKFFDALELVTSSGIYQSTLGSRHIFVDNGGWAFNWQTVTGVQMAIKFYEPEWAKNRCEPDWFKNYSQWQTNIDKPCSCDDNTLIIHCLKSVFKNNILAKERDMWALREIHLNKGYSGDFNALVAKHDPIPSYGFSFGLMDDHYVPLEKPSYSKYRKSDWIFFYHSRREPSVNNSTVYRHAPMTRLPTNGTEEQVTFQNSSIGFDIDKKTWIDRMNKSKFCLVIRGDDPMSRALTRAIRIGCIPVVISDLFPVYAPPFKSTLNFSDYSIMIDEKDFLADPWGTLHHVYYGLTENEVKRKLNAIAFVQRVIFLDHPESLFVPAFLKEAWQSIPDSERGIGCVKEKCHE